MALALPVFQPFAFLAKAEPVREPAYLKRVEKFQSAPSR